MNTKHAVFGALIGLSGMASGAALGSIGTDDTVSERAAALERLEAARAAFEAAKAELEDAQRDAAALAGGGVDAGGDAGAQPEQAAAAGDEPAEVLEPTGWTQGWDWKVLVGINGSSGNSENFSARAVLTGERDTSKTETDLRLSYIYKTSNGDADTSRGEAEIRNDWLREDAWRFFAEGMYEYDEFQAWDHRVSGAGGVGYMFIENDKQELLGRIGFGGSYQIGGDADEEFRPEALLGLDWKYHWTQNTTLTATTEYLPDLDEISEFRWNTRAMLEVTLDEENGLTLNTGFEHRYDSMPGDDKDNSDIDYYMGLGWSF